jgi:hypothetical protein
MFSLDRQALAFLAVIALLAVVMIPLAPFALLALGGLAAILLLVLWLKTAIRARSLIAPFTPVEGALALSALFLVVGAATVSGLMVARLGLGQAVSLGGAMFPMTSSGPRVGDRSVYYSDADTRQRLKENLTKAGVPFKVRDEGGKEYISWSQEHDSAAEKASEQARSGGWVNDPSSDSRSVHWGTPATQKEFIAWLAKRGIKSEIVERDGKDYVNWRENAPIQTVMEKFLAERGTVKCKDARKSAKC